MANVFGGKAGRNAAIWAAGFQKDNLGASMDYLNQGESKANAAYDDATAAWTPLRDLFMRGSNLRADALGLNGADGADRARTSFQAGPGYQFQQDEALRAGTRAAAAGGRLASGNTLAALAARAQGLANTEYGNWVDRLNSYDQGSQNAASGLSGIANQRANTALQLAGNRAQLQDKYGDAVTSAGMSGMMAGQQGAANRLNFGMQLGNTIANLAAKAIGAGM